MKRIINRVGWVFVPFLLFGCKSIHKTVISTDVTIFEMIDKKRQELKSVLPEDVIVEPVYNREALKVTFYSGRIFAANSNTLTEESKNTIHKFAEIINNIPDTNIQITGYTDNTGREDYNQTLSERRAKSVYDYLYEQGVEPIRMQYSGKGIHDPVADNDSAEGRTLNRRIEIVIEMSPTITQ